MPPQFWIWVQLCPLFFYALVYEFHTYHDTSRFPLPQKSVREQEVDQAASRRIRNYNSPAIMPTTASNKTNTAAAGNTAAADNVEDDPLFFLEAEELDEDTKNVMNARITDGTREGYERGLVKVMLWAFDNLETYPDFFTPSTLEILKAAHLKDKARKT